MVNVTFLKIGYIGIGIMGQPMAGNLLKAGLSLSGIELAQGLFNKAQAEGGQLGPQALCRIVGESDHLNT